MSKNKSLRRIDKEYNKQLKYPDINDYLKDTSYSVVTSNYHDNLIDTQLTYRMQDEDLELGVIRVANTPLDAYLNAFILYGYHPDLESVSEIRLTVDAFSVENEDTGVFSPRPYTIRLFNNKRRDRWSVILQALLPNLNVNKVVNYGIYLSNQTVANLYNYVFNTTFSNRDSKRKVLRRYIHADMYEDLTSDEEKLRQYVKENLYSLRIPIRVEYYYFEDDEAPAFTFISNFNMRPVLSKIRNSLRIRSLNVRLTPPGTSDYIAGNYFTWTAVLDNTVSIIPKYAIGSSTSFDNYSKLVRLAKPDGDSDSRVVYNRFIANEHQLIAHSAFRIWYPEIKIRYNWKWSDNTDVIVFTDVDLLNPIRFGGVSTSPLSIKNYFIGHNPAANQEKNKDKFRIHITFTVDASYSDLMSKIDKFQLQFFNDGSNYALLGGSLNKTNADKAELCSYNEPPEWTHLENTGTHTRYRTLAASTDKERNKCRMFAASITDSEPTVYNNSDYFTKNLSQYTARIIESTPGFMTLIIEWPDERDNLVKYFWPFAHFSKIKLTLGDFFQRGYFIGEVEKNLWDVYSIDKNPFRLFALASNNSSRVWYPRGSRLKLNSSTVIKSFSFNPAGDAVLNSRVQFLNPRKNLSLNVPSSVNLIEISYLIGLFCRGFYLANSNRSQMNDAVFMQNSAFVIGAKVKNSIKYNKFNTAHYLKNYRSIINSSSMDFNYSTFSIKLNKTNLLNLIKTAGGIGSGKGTLLLIPPFKSGAGFFEFSHASGKLQNGTLFIVSKA